MSKRLFLLIYVALVLSLAGYALAYDAVIPQATPIIDGIKDPNWNVSSGYKIATCCVGTPAPDSANLSANWWAVWDTEYLYVFFDVNDNVLVNDSWASYDDDSVEVFIDIGNDKNPQPPGYGDDDYEYRVSWNEFPIGIEEYDHPPRSLTGVEYKLVTKDGNIGYTVEIKFPWSTLDATGRGMSVHSLNSLMGLEVQVNDDDNGNTRERSYAWINSENVAWNNPSTFGTVILGPGLKACGPHPADDEEGVRSGLLQWSAGIFASFHKVYFDTSQAKVQARSGCMVNGVFRTEPNYIVYLEPITTYYWVIDEFNESLMPPPGFWPGDIWTFTTAPLTARSPDPCDGEQWVDTQKDLFWSTGFYASSHKVYFDTSEAKVQNRSGCQINGVSCVDPCYPLPGLDMFTTYYWAIDEVNTTGPDPCVWPGDVWEFKTLPVPCPGYIMREVWEGIAGTEVNNLTSNPRYPDNPTFIEPLWEFEAPRDWADNYGTRIRGWLYILYSGNYTFWISSKDQSELWLSTDDDPENAIMIASVPTHNIIPLTWDEFYEQKSVPIHLIGGNMYYICALHKAGTGGDHLAVAWSTSADPNTAEVIGCGLIPYVQRVSFRPSPANRATDVRSAPILSWSPGIYAATHDVYFGTDIEDVKNASRNEPCGVLVGQDLPSVRPTTTYDITNDVNVGLLEFDTTYYWRIDDVNMNIDPYPHIYKGRLWSFTTGRFHVVEDFEKYANTDEMNDVWRTVLGMSLTTTITASSEIVCGQIHNGTQAMAIDYNCSVSPYRSEVSAGSNGANSLGFGTNWRLKDVKALSLWFHGIEDLRGSKSGTDPYTLIGDGSGIRGAYDVFYFFYRTKAAAPAEGLVAARVDSIENTDPSAMAGVMIRDSLNPDSIYGATVVTPDNRVIFMGRGNAGGNASAIATVSGITFPHWVRIKRSGTPTMVVAQHANDVGGSPDKWSQIGPSLPWGMTSPLYLGLCDTSNSYGNMCTAQFKYVDVNAPYNTRVGDPDTTKDIGGYVYNAPEPMYVVLQDSPAADGNGIVYYENKDANVTQIADWTEWRIDMNNFMDQGVDPCNILRMYIGFGNKDNPAAGGTGTMYFDDIRLYRAEFYEPECPPFPSDLVRDGEVNYDDLKILTDNWLQTPPDPNINLYNDGSIDFRDFAEMAEHWGETQVWPTW